MYTIPSGWLAAGAAWKCLASALCAWDLRVHVVVSTRTGVASTGSLYVS